MATVTIPNELLSTTAMSYVEDITDQLAVNDPLLDRMDKVHGIGKPKNIGGVNIVVPLGWTEHSVTSSYENGFEEEAGDAQESTIPAQYNWFFASRPIQLSWTEEEMNQGEPAMISILEAKSQGAAGGLMREQHKQSVAGGVVPFTNKPTRKAATLNGRDYAVAGAQGYLEGVDPVSQVHTVGTVDKTGAYTAGKLNWVNQFSDVTAGGGTFGSDGLQAFDNMTIAARTIRMGGAEGMFWLLNKATFANLKRALRVNERYMETKKLDGGRLVMAWDGADVEVSEYVPANLGYMLNTEEIYYNWLGDNRFSVGDFVDGRAGGYQVKRGSIRLAYQLVAKSMGTSGMIINCDTY